MPVSRDRDLAPAHNSLAAKLAQAGGAENERAALYWYLLAIESGYVESMWNAGTMLLNGEGGVHDVSFGHHLIHIAADHGQNSACLSWQTAMNSVWTGLTAMPNLLTNGVGPHGTSTAAKTRRPNQRR